MLRSLTCWFAVVATYVPTASARCRPGSGLSLGDSLRLQAAETGQEGQGPVVHPHLHAGRHGPPGIVRPEAVRPGRVPRRDGLDSTKLEGVPFNECLKQTAKIADKITVCRSMTHGEAAHERGTHNMFTGYRPSPALTFPSMGSVVSHELGVRNNLPPYVAVPKHADELRRQRLPVQRVRPFSLGSDPANGGFRVQDLSLPGGVTPDRFATRRNMLDAVNDHFAAKEKSDNLDAMDTFYQRAYGLISSEKARAAFDINAEDAKLRDEYGRNAAGAAHAHGPPAGPAGVRFVTLHYGGWDFHGGIAANTRNQLPRVRPGLRGPHPRSLRPGMLDSTLIMVSSEFGRTPKINGTAAAAITGPRCSAWCSPAAASRRASSTASPTPPPASRRRTA